MLGESEGFLFRDENIAWPTTWITILSGEGVCAILHTPTNFWTAGDIELKLYMVINNYQKWKKIRFKVLWRHNYASVDRSEAKSGQIRSTFESLISREKKWKRRNGRRFYPFNKALQIYGGCTTPFWHVKKCTFAYDMNLKLYR